MTNQQFVRQFITGVVLAMLLLITGDMITFFIIGDDFRSNEWTMSDVGFMLCGGLLATKRKWKNPL